MKLGPALPVFLGLLAPAAASPLSRLPLDFVENRGQWNAPVKFVAHKGPSAAAFEKHAIRLRRGSGRSASLALVFENASEHTTLVGENKRRGYHSFFIGGDPARWRSRVPAYNSIRYRGLYPGVDVRVREAGGGRLEYDLLLAPRADLNRVAIRAEGISGMEIARDGSLVMETAAGPLRQAPPTTWETLPGGGKHPVACRYRQIDARRYGFTVARRDPGRPLVIDPGLEWATFLGGRDGEEIFGLAAVGDGTGDVVVAGATFSADFPATGGVRPAPALVSFVARVNGTGTGLAYATYFGSDSHYAWVRDVALDAAGAPVVVGFTRAADYPTTPGAYDATYAGNGSVGDDVFVTRFDASGSRLVFSTYLGAAGTEEGHQVVVDATGAVIAAGWTTSTDFPTTPGAYDRTLSARIGTQNSSRDLFVSRLNPTGTELTYSTLLGGQVDEAVNGLVVDPFGFVTLAGSAYPEMQMDLDGNITPLGTPFPTTPDAVQRTHAGNYPTRTDAVLARLRLDGAGAADLRYSTILGGFSSEAATGIALDPNDPELVTIAGHSASWDFRTTPGVLRRTPISPEDWRLAFVSRFRFPGSGGGTLLWSTLLGGPNNQIATDVAVDGAGAAIVAGSGGMDFPTTERAYDRVGVSRDAIIARVSADGRQILYATLLGGSGDEAIRDELRMAAGGGSSVIVAGNTLSADFPVTPAAFDRIFNADGTGDGFYQTDGFVAKLTLEPNATGDTTASAPALVSPANGAAFPAPTQTQTVVPVPFDWTDVADPSGVQLYQLEVSPDPDFFLNRLNVAEWVVRETPVSSAEVTFIHWVGHQGVYFWRVRTLDNANNWSPWSEVRTLHLGTSSIPRISHAVLDRSEVIGGGTVLGTAVLQDRRAPAGGTRLTLVSSNPAVASVPASVTVPAGADRVTFPVTTRPVTVSTPVKITVSDDGLPVTPVLWVDPGAAPAAALSTLTLSPTGVTGGSSSTGTVTLSAAAPSGGAAVSLSSGNTAAAVPASVTIPAGAASAAFTVTTRTVSAQTSVTISAAYGGVTKAAALTVNPDSSAPPPTPDTVGIPRAEYETSKRTLRVEATSTNAQATLKVYVTASGALIGTLANNGGGRYNGQFTGVAANPVNITVRSDKGGSATRAVVVK